LAKANAYPRPKDKQQDNFCGPDGSGSPQGGTTEDYKRTAGRAAQMELKEKN